MANRIAALVAEIRNMSGWNNKMVRMRRGGNGQRETRLFGVAVQRRARPAQRPPHAGRHVMAKG